MCSRFSLKFFDQTNSNELQTVLFRRIIAKLQTYFRTKIWNRLIKSKELKQLKTY